MANLDFTVLEGTEEDIRKVGAFLDDDLIAEIVPNDDGMAEVIGIRPDIAEDVSGTYKDFGVARTALAKAVSGAGKTVKTVKNKTPKPKKEKEPATARERRELVEARAGKILIRLNAKQTAALLSSPDEVSRKQKDLQFAISEEQRRYYKHDDTMVLFVSPELAVDILRWSQSKEGQAFVAGSRALERQIRERAPEGTISVAA
jgi:hypothetical protein